MTTAAVLNLIVDAQTSSATAAMKKFDSTVARAGTTTRAATAHTSKFDSTSRKLGSTLSNAAKYAAGAAAAYLSISQAKAAIATTQDLAKATLGLQANLGLSGKAAGEWAAVARARGADTNKLSMAFKTLSGQVESARQGSAGATKMFDSLGISQKELEAGSRDVSGLMLEIADGMDELGAGTERTNVTSKLFGRSWTTIAPLIRDGSKALEQNLAVSEKYGAALHGHVLKQQEALRSSVIESKIAWMGLQNTFSIAVTPALMAAEDQFNKIARILHDPRLTDDQRFSKVANIIEQDFSQALDVVVKMIPTVADKVGQQAPKIVSGLIQGFLHADEWGRLALGGWLLAKFGGWRAFTVLGAGMGARMGTGMAAGMAAPTAAGAAAAGTAAAGAGTAAAAGFASRFGLALRTIGPRLGLLGAGAFAGNEILTGIQNEIDASSSDLRTHLSGLASEGFKGTARNIMNAPVPGLGDLIQGGKSKEDQAAQRLLDILDRINETHGHISRKLLQEGLRSQRLLDLNGEQNAQLNEQFQLAQRFQDQLLGRRKGFGIAAAIAQDGKLVGPEVAGILDKLEKLPQGARKEAANTVIGMAKVWEQKGKLPEGAADAIRANVTAKFKHLKVDTVDASFKTAKGVALNFGALQTAVSAGMDLIGRNTNSALKAFGVDRLKFTIKHPDKAGAFLGNLAGAFQQGGPVPGVGNTDSVHAMLTPGEFVVRKEQTARHRALLEAINAKGLASGGYVDLWGRGMQHLAKGGVIEQALGPYSIPPIQYDPNHAGGNSHVHADFHTVAQALAYGHKMQGMGWSIGEYTPRQGNPYHFGPITTQHQSAGHYDGTAFDANTAADETRAQVAAVAKLFNSGVAGAAVEKLKRILLAGSKGPLLNMGQASLDKVRNAANRYLSQQAPTMNTTGMDVGKGALSRGAMRSLLKANRLPDIMGWVAGAETNWNPSITNSIGATGLFQILKSAHPDLNARFNLLDAAQNTAAAATLYRANGLADWAASAHAGGLGGDGGWAQMQGVPFRKGGMVMPPFAGSFGSGGMVPGPVGSPRTVIAHGGESIGQPIIHVHVHVAPGSGADLLGDRISTDIEQAMDEREAHTRQLERMR